MSTAVTPVPNVQMSRLDRAIASVAPTYGLRRFGAKVQLAAAANFFGRGGYNSARSDRPALKEWNPRNGSADESSIPDLPTLRSRARDLARNNPIVAGALSTHTTSIVGSGLVPHPRLDRTLLQLTDDAAEGWERQAERIWWAWAGSKACDITRRANFAGLTALVLRSWLASGDVFVVRRFQERKGELLGMKLQLVEADRVCNPNFRQRDDILDGIEIDENGVAVAVHIADQHPQGAFGTIGPCTWTRVNVYGADSGICQVLQVYTQDRPGQTRGVSIFAPVIENLMQLGRYADAELMAAVINSFFTAFIKTAAGEDGLPDIDPKTAPIATGPVADVRLGSGNIVQLAAGEEMEFAEPKRPSAGFDPFFRAFLSQIGVALDLPHELLIKHFTSSYSASRAALLEAWRSFMMRRSQLVDLFAQPCYEWVITEAVSRGLLDAPGFFDDALVRAAWCETQWTGPAQGQIDPLSEVQAAEKKISLRLASRQEIASEMFGTDWYRTVLQLGKEREIMKKSGLDSADVADRTEPAVVGAPKKSGQSSSGD